MFQCSQLQCQCNICKFNKHARVEYTYRRRWFNTHHGHSLPLNASSKSRRRTPRSVPGRGNVLQQRWLRADGHCLNVPLCWKIARAFQQASFFARRALLLHTQVLTFCVDATCIEQQGLPDMSATGVTSWESVEGTFSLLQELSDAPSPRL